MEDNMRLVFNLTRFELQYPEFLQNRIPSILDEEVLTPIKQRMKDFGYSQKIIDSTRIENITITRFGTVEYEVVSDYESSEGFDVAAAREKGTTRHFVKPTKKRALSFILQGATGLISSFRAFSKGHWVSGITASNIIVKSIEEFNPIAQQRINDETDVFFTRSVDGNGS